MAAKTKTVMQYFNVIYAQKPSQEVNMLLTYCVNNSVANFRDNVNLQVNWIPKITFDYQTISQSIIVE